MPRQKNNLEEDGTVDLSTLTVVEAAELARMLEEKWANSPNVVKDSNKHEEKQTSFDVILEAPGINRIEFMKILRNATRLSFRDLKEILDDLPRPLAIDVDLEEATRISDIVNRAGGRLETKYSWKTYQEVFLNKNKSDYTDKSNNNLEYLTDDEWIEAMISALRIQYSKITPPSTHLAQIKEILGGIK